MRDAPDQAGRADYLREELGELSPAAARDRARRRQHEGEDSGRTQTKRFLTAMFVLGGVVVALVAMLVVGILLLG